MPELKPEGIGRRSFLKTGAVAGAGILSSIGTLEALALPPTPSADLYTLSAQLAEQWLAALLKLQVTDAAQGLDYGGIRGPGDAGVPGRIAETIYPLLRAARRSQQSRYLDAAHLLFRWAENRVSQPDGSWLNEPQKGSWKGTTVFMAVALAEAVKNHGTVLDNQFKAALLDRLLKAGNFIYDTFTLEYGNINYPVAATYGLALLGEVLDVPRFRQKAQALAHGALGYFSPASNLLVGEGRPALQTSAKGCYPVDLGYNVEESLPALALYGHLVHDEEVLAAATRGLQAHLEFMLPDGGWDNSWGSRNYKWTYWGSRTSDGCQPAFALLAGRDPRFYKAALRNTQLLQHCTVGGLLTGGPHAAAHVPTSVHHTFCHLKALTTILDQPAAVAPDLRRVRLPREQAYGSRYVRDIATWLLAQGPYRATVTGYDCEYNTYRNGHASGGALSLLWHEKAGPLLAASMNAYQRFEAGNMPPDSAPPAPCLTPRVELRLGEELFMSISDLSAVPVVHDAAGQSTVTVVAKLVDRDQRSPPAGPVTCRLTYLFTADKVSLHFVAEPGPYDGQVRIVVPVIAAATERFTAQSDRRLQLAKRGATLFVSATQAFAPSPAPTSRVFNFVPGFEAVPLCFPGPEVTLELAVK
ncbi:hypothetical protein [Hymenobacter rubidus]|uniref:hypothetical protein n=1 Tax=Hymenobacter rubidus TaxID=1441626 RepID=UPI00191FB5BA|nr:hypothetical protein [Hymenobacter rubidus]